MRIRMHNYIDIHFIRSIPGYVPFPGENMSDIYRTKVDLLMRDLSRPNLFAGYNFRERGIGNLLQEALSAYFMNDIDDTGAGWAGNGQAHNFQERNTDMRFHQAPFIHESAFGRQIRDYTFEEIPPKLIQLRTVVELLSRLKRDWMRQRELWQSLVDFLFYWTTDISKFIEIGTNIDEYLRIFGYSPLMQQLSDLDDTEMIPFTPVSQQDYDATGFSRNDQDLIEAAIGSKYIRRSEVIFKPGWIVSMLLLGNFETLSLFPNSNSLITDGWARMDDIQDVVNMWTLVKKYLPKELFSRSERVQYALSLVSNQSVSMLKSVFEGNGIVINQVIPIEGSKVYVDKFELVKIRFLDNFKSMFGITEEVIFKGHRKVAFNIDTPFKYHTLADETESPTKVITYRRLFELTRDDRTFEELRAAGPIIFKIPTLFNAYEMSADKFYPKVYEKSDLGGSNVEDIVIHELPVMYRWRDDDRRMTEFALLSDPVWSTGEFPFMIIRPQEITNYLLQQAEVYKNYTLFSTFQRDMVYKDGF